MPFELRKLVRWVRDTPPDAGAILRYGLAVIAVLAATAVRAAFNPVLGVEAPHVPFALAVITAAWVGGRGPGLAATALSTLSVDWFFIEPRHGFLISHPEDVWGLALFVVTAVLISLLVGRLRESLLARSKTEQALLRHVQLIDLSHDAVITMDSERRILTWNRGAEEIYGWPEREAVGRVLPELLQSPCAISSEVDEILLHEGRWEGELTYTARDGRRVIVDSRKVLFGGADGLPPGILAISRNITERKQAEEALRQSEEQFRTLANTIPHLCGMANPNGSFFWMNRRWHEYTGHTPEESAGLGWLAAVAPEASLEAMERWQHSVAAGEPFEMVLPLRGVDGVVRPFLSRSMPVHDREGRIARWFGTMTDISEQRRTENILRKAHREQLTRAQELEAIMDAVPVALFISRDPEVRTVIGNPAAYKLLRAPAGTDLSKPTRPDGPPAIRLMKNGQEIPWPELPMERAAATGQPVYGYEMDMVFQDGTTTTILGNAVPFLDAEGRAHGSVGAFVDITERKRNEERFLQAQKLESIGLLAGGIAHDFNNLLTVIIGNTDSALQEDPTSTELQHVLSASERAAELTRQLLAYAGKGQFVAKTFDLSELVFGFRPLLESSVPKTLELVYRLSEQEVLIQADPSQIEQILMNLVTNAAEAIPPHIAGRIEIGTGTCQVTPEAARKHGPPLEARPGEFVCLEVKDNGSGMDEATLAHIFEPFFSTKFMGRGLGLAAAQGIVRSCSGFIEVRSSVGGGSLFRVFFPAAKKSAAGGPTDARSGTARRRKRRPETILVVDDEEMVRQLACAALRSAGHHVLEAGNGREALEALAGADPLPSLVLLDLTMPAMSGEELVSILNERYPNLRIIVTSGYPKEEAIRRFPPDAVTGFLEKPYTVPKLMEAVETAWNGGPNEEAPAAA